MESMRALNPRRLAAAVGLVLAGILAASFVRPAAAQGAVTVPESNDFATLLLRDPWDMSQFSDISQFLNNSGQSVTGFDWLQDSSIQVNSGVFSAIAGNSSSDPGERGGYFVLSPGYYIDSTNVAINPGKNGRNYPIAAAKYHCLFVAMQTQSPPPGDSFAIRWLTDNRYGPTPWGETSVPITSANWKLYSIDLNTMASGYGSRWTAPPADGMWRGLRLAGTSTAGVGFNVDWVRLTDCATDVANITWTPNVSVNAIWMTPQGTTRNILAATGINGATGSYALDVRGIAPGTYQVNLGTATTCCSVSASTLTVNQAPTANVTSPSVTSGIDYATQAGTPWNFSGDNTTQSTLTGWVNLKSTAFSNGIMDLTTASGAYHGSGTSVAQPTLYLNTPQPIASGSTYRYLTFRMFTPRPPLQSVPWGTVIRWFWWVGSGCTMVSWDAPFDVGWQTYTIDLQDPHDGTAGESPGCPANLTWSTSTNITRMAFQPNEDVLGFDLAQQLDWITLTQVDRIARSLPFPIQLSLNKDPALVPTRTFYYTTNLNNPYQNLVVPSAHAPIARRAPVNSSGNIFLPFVARSPLPTPTPHPAPPLVANEVDYAWDTTNVATGTYFICVKLNDGIQETTSCSEAPVVVY